MKVFLLMTCYLALSHGIIFNCDYTKVNFEADNFGNVYSCHRATATIGKSLLTLESAKGNHFWCCWVSDSSVNGLTVYNDRLMQSFPTRIEGTFPNLNVISWTHSSLNSVTPESLRFSQLKILRLYNNKIASLDGNVFKYMHRLNSIDFDGNLISIIGSNLLNNLNELKQAYFRYNLCLDSLAYTSQGILNLKKQLVDQCSSLPTTTQQTTMTPASTTTAQPNFPRSSINDEVDELSTKLNEQTTLNALQIKDLGEKNAEQLKTTATLEQRINDLSVLVVKSEARILELEKKMREILAKP